MRLHSFAAVVFLALSTAAHAQTDDAASRLAAAETMLAASHEQELQTERLDLTVEHTVAQFKAASPDVSDADAQRFGGLLREEMQRDMIRLLHLRAQYYADHFTLAELKAWTGLVQSDIGQKILSAEPGMMRDLYSVDYQWFEDAARRAAARYGQQDGAKPL